MPKNLVIVESPAKAKTIENYLGKDYKVASSYGHIVDLPKKNMGIEIENNFKPIYKVSPDKKDVVKKLKELASKADTVWLASDEDREGEAIAWHLFNELKLDKSNTKRIVFNEITKKAIQNAIENPRDIDIDLVNAQQTRRVLDRLVGFEMSPVLWKKIKPGLSAGRVQSIAVRLIVEREQEILDFVPKNSFKVQAEFSTEKSENFSATLDTEFDTYEDTIQFLKTCAGANFHISAVEKKAGKRSPSAPFTTSTLQQEASRKLGFPVARTMRVAQQLYEQGFITYMRTDSVHLSQDALRDAKNVIHTEFGEKYSKQRNYTSKSKGAQEAHEAIRPTDFSVKLAGTDAAQQRLYDLIRKRTLASQMADAALERTVVDIENNNNPRIFKARGEVILFDGFLKLYQESSDDDTAENTSGFLPQLSKGQALEYLNITGTEKFTRQPPRYTEATLVRQLEELGIGRPSTYAPTISTIQKRDYVELYNSEGENRDIRTVALTQGNIEEKTIQEKYGSERKKLKPTDVGIVVNDFLVQHFQRIMDYQFTAQVEEEFDEIAEGNEDWIKVLDNFYERFHANILEVEENAERATGERLLGQEKSTGKNIYARIGRYGAMIQIGEADETEKPRFASLQPDQNIATITLEEALKLFDLPKKLGSHKEHDLIVNTGRYGPYVQWDKTYVSLPKGTDPNDVEFPFALKLLEEKLKQDAPIGNYENMPITKGKGRFGPFIKWNEMYINVGKKYDFDNLSQADLKELIEDKLRKEREKVVRVLEEEGIRIEKARWGRHNVIKGKTKIELAKEVDVQALKPAELVAMFDKPATKSRRKSK
ncbi:MAG: type I DNA topoisomerase [Weeksellaceae bacterium]|nr:type I DNA topoisomerase [Weeksellaceae bacterium]